VWIFEISNWIVTLVIDLILNEHNYSNFRILTVTNFLLIYQNDSDFLPKQPRLATNKINKRGVLQLLMRCRKNSWIYLTSTYYWWLLRPMITIRFDSKFQIIAQLFDSKWKKHCSHSTNLFYEGGSCLLHCCELLCIAVHMTQNVDSVVTVCAWMWEEYPTQ